MAEKKKPYLKNLDELFGLSDGIIPKTQEETLQENKKRNQSTLPISALTPFKGHPFHLYEGERLDDMVASIKNNGVLIPIIVRTVGDCFEILSGHNRVNAAKLAGLERVPVIPLENISDEEAWMYVVETNLMQRSFADMAHSEKAAVIATQHSKLFSQGKRNDILKQLEILDNPHSNNENRTFPQVAEKLHSDRKVAEMYSLSRDTVARYLRIDKLIQPLKTRLDNDEFSFIPAVDISFLKEHEQVLLDQCFSLNGFKVDMKKAALLRQFSESGKLDEVRISLILSGETRTAGKQRRSYSFKIKPKVYKKYFTEQLKPPEVEAIIEKALELFFQHNEL
jgi:ParB family chromosome partitioning protein